MTHVLEGTWEQIKTHEAELAGRRLRVFVEIDDVPASAPVKPIYETGTPAEWSQAWRAWADSHNHKGPLLSDEAISRGAR